MTITDSNNNNNNINHGEEVIEQQDTSYGELSMINTSFTKGFLNVNKSTE